MSVAALRIFGAAMMDAFWDSIVFGAKHALRYLLWVMCARTFTDRMLALASLCALWLALLSFVALLGIA